MKNILKFAAIAAMTLSLSACFENIETGNVGVVSFMGQTNAEVLPPGTYQTITRTVYEINGRTQTYSFDKMHPKTMDNLTMAEFDCDLFIHLNAEKVTVLFNRFRNDLHDNGKGSYDLAWNFINKQASEAIFAGVAQFEAPTIHLHRDELSAIVIKTLQAHLDKELGKNWGQVESMTIRKSLTDPNMEESIRGIINAKFETEKKEAQQSAAVAEAKRLKIEQVGKAEAQAAADVAEAEGRAKANKIVNDSLTPNVIRVIELDMMKQFAQRGGSNTVLLPTGQTISPMLNVTPK